MDRLNAVIKMDRADGSGCCANEAGKVFVGRVPLISTRGVAPVNIVTTDFNPLVDTNIH